jgi:hypothetical protein
MSFMSENKIDNDKGFNLPLGANLSSNLDFLSIKPIAKYLSGARCILRVNSKIIGFATAISWEIKTSAIEIITIDDFLPYELAPQRIEISGNISGFRIPGSGPSYSLIQSDINSFLHQRYIDIEVRDSQTDNIIFATKKAMVVSRSEHIRIDQLADMSLSFKAIGWADEKDLSEDVQGLGKPPA